MSASFSNSFLPSPLAERIDELAGNGAWGDLRDIVCANRLDAASWAALRGCEEMASPSPQRDQFLRFLLETQSEALALNARASRSLSWWAPSAWLDLEIAAIGGFRDSEQNAILAIESLEGAAKTWEATALARLAAHGAGFWAGDRERSKLELHWLEGVLNCAHGEQDAWLASRTFNALAQADLLLPSAPIRLAAEFFDVSPHDRAHFLLGHARSPEGGMAALALLNANGASLMAQGRWPAWRAQIASRAAALPESTAWAQAEATARAWEERAELTASVHAVKELSDATSEKKAFRL